MKRKILLIAILSSLSMSVYPARVTIKNETNQSIWVYAHDSGQDRRLGIAAQKTDFLRGKVQEITFFRIKKNLILKGAFGELTNQLRNYPELGGMVRLTKDTHGRYGSYCNYFTDPNKKRQRPCTALFLGDTGNQSIRIHVPQVEHFTYHLSEGKRMLTLKSWGNVV